MTNESDLQSIIATLWEWAESKGSWALLLIHKIITTKTFVSEKELNSIFEVFLAENKLSGIEKK